MKLEDVRFEEEGIRFTDYPYPPASVYPSRFVRYGSIREVLPSFAPPEIRTKDGEVLFVSATMKDKLLAAAKRNNLPVVSRVDTWHSILEPFLDAEWDDIKALEQLEANGVDLAECREIRKSLRKAMHAYNILSGICDWCHLGLSCALDALLVDGPISQCHQYALPPDDYRVFYHRAMKIAECGKLVMDVCPVCDYDLSGNSAGRCPECGSIAIHSRS